jgi:cytochrome-b5 reductase
MLNPQEWHSFKVANVRTVTHDSFYISFQFPQAVQMQVSSFVKMRADSCRDAKGEYNIRPYTPIRAYSDAENCLTFCVKSYAQGNMSRHLASLQAGDSIEMQGPFLKFPYQANKTSNIVLLAGGTGITPMYQIATKAQENKDDNTKVIIINCNHTENDVLMTRPEEQSALNLHGKTVTFHNIITQGSGSRLTQEQLGALIPADSFVCICGPPSFYNTICGPKGPNFTQGDCSGYLAALGFTSNLICKI